MRSSSHAAPAATTLRDRILHAAFAAFTEEGYAQTSTLDIARRARVSKRDLYASFDDKHAMLVACISRRAERMRLPPDLPAPRDRKMLAATLTAFAAKLLCEISGTAVIAAFRLAIAEATRSPEIARTLDAAGRYPARQALGQLLASAQSSGLLAAADPMQMAAQYLGLLWEGLMVELLLGVAEAPGPAEAELRAGRATAAFMQLHPDPATNH